MNTNDKPDPAIVENLNLDEMSKEEIQEHFRTPSTDVSEVNALAKLYPPLDANLEDAWLFGSTVEPEHSWIHANPIQREGERIFISSKIIKSDNPDQPDNQVITTRIGHQEATIVKSPILKRGEFFFHGRLIPGAVNRKTMLGVDPADPRWRVVPMEQDILSPPAGGGKTEEAQRLAEVMKGHGQKTVLLTPGRRTGRNSLTKAIGEVLTKKFTGTSIVEMDSLSEYDPSKREPLYKVSKEAPEVEKPKLNPLTAALLNRLK